MGQLLLILLITYENKPARFVRWVIGGHRGVKRVQKSSKSL